MTPQLLPTNFFLGMPHSRILPRIVIALCLLIGSGGFLTHSTYAAPTDTLNDGLVGYWTFDEADGEGKVFDRSSRGVDLLVFNNPLRTDGKIGRAMTFDGKSQFLRSERTVDLSDTKIISLSLWMKGKFDPLSSWSATTIFEITQDMNKSLSAGAFSFDNTGCKNQFSVVETGINVTSGTFAYNLSCYSQPVSEGWHHYVALFDKSKSGNETDLFIDGVLQKPASRPINSDNINNFSNAELYFMSRAGKMYFSKSTLDDIRLYNRALTQDEITQLYIRSNTLSLTLLPPSTQTLSNATPIDFTATLSLPTQIVTSNPESVVRIKFSDGRTLPLKYDREDTASGHSLWRGITYQPNGLTNQPVDLRGTLQYADCTQITGHSLPFQTSNTTPGTTVFSNDQEDGKAVTRSEFSPDPSFLAQSNSPSTGFIAWFQRTFSWFFPPTVITPSATQIATFLQEEEDTVLSERDLQKMCRVNDTFACGRSTVSDIDGNVYGTVQIGTQCWMNENLMTTRRPDGTAITRGLPEDNTWNGSDNGYYSYPPNTDGNPAEETLDNIRTNKLGFLYQWSAAMAGSTTEGAQGICPVGWHVPTDDEQNTLDQYLTDTGQTCDANRNNTWDYCSSAGTKLKPGGSSGFNAPLTGIRNNTGRFVYRGTHAYWWSSSQSGGSAWDRALYPTFSTVYRKLDLKAGGFSLRCLRD